MTADDQDHVCVFLRYLHDARRGTDRKRKGYDLDSLEVGVRQCLPLALQALAWDRGSVERSLAADLERVRMVVKDCRYFVRRHGVPAVGYRAASLLTGSSMPTIRRAVAAGELKPVSRRTRPVGLRLADVIAWAFMDRSLPADSRLREINVLWRTAFLDRADLPSGLPGSHQNRYTAQLCEALPPAHIPVPSCLSDVLAPLTAGEICLLRGWLLAYLCKSARKKVDPVLLVRAVFGLFKVYHDKEGQRTPMDILKALVPDFYLCPKCSHRGVHKGYQPESVTVFSPQHERRALVSVGPGADRDSPAGDFLDMRCDSCGNEYEVRREDWEEDVTRLTDQLKSSGRLKANPRPPTAHDVDKLVSALRKAGKPLKTCCPSCGKRGVITPGQSSDGPGSILDLDAIFQFKSAPRSKDDGGGNPSKEDTSPYAFVAKMLCPNCGAEYEVGREQRAQVLEAMTSDIAAARELYGDGSILPETTELTRLLHAMRLERMHKIGWEADVTCADIGRALCTSRSRAWSSWRRAEQRRGKQDWGVLVRGVCRSLATATTWVSPRLSHAFPGVLVAVLTQQLELRLPASRRLPAPRRQTAMPAPSANALNAPWPGPVDYDWSRQRRRGKRHG